MSKLVRYNGEKLSFSGCSNPNSLVVGRLYKVSGKEVLGFQTNYILQNVKGKFNSVWFQEIKGPFICITKRQPQIGKPMEQLITLERDTPKHVKLERIAKTSTVLSLEPIMDNVYKAETRNSIYIVQVVE